MPLSNKVAPPKLRVYYLDWLRVCAILTVFFYHSNRFFNYGDWHVKNPQLSLASTIFENSISAWLMPLIFTLSGAAVYYSLKSRDAGEYCRERFYRLLVPLVTLGMFVLGPPQIYLERISHRAFSGSFWQFFPHYFEGLYGFGGNFAWMGVHLWYLMLLFLFSLLFLPLFLLLRKNENRITSILASIFERPWALFLLFIPLTLASKLTDALDMGTTREMGGWDTFSYMVFFMYGYLLITSPRVSETVRKYNILYLITAILLSAFGLVMRYIIMPTPNIGFFFSTELGALIAWLWILTIVGAGSRYLASNKPFLSYANEAVLPFYILHQPIILLIGYFVVQWPLSITSKYLIIVVISFVVIAAIYEILVRRMNFLRFLFGMKRLKRAQLKEAPARAA